MAYKSCCHACSSKKGFICCTGAGESYEDNAVRELQEEMGIRAGQLTTHFDFYHADSVCRLWGRLFSCQWAGDEIKLDPEEVESGSFMSLADVAELLETGPVCPDSKAAVERYLHRQPPTLGPGT